MNVSDILLRLGTEAPEAPRLPLEAGALRCMLQGGAIRDVTWRGVEVLRGAAYLLRDRDWGTPPPELSEPRIETDAQSFRATFDGRVVVEGHTFRFSARLEGRATGRLTFQVEGIAEGAIETNRCGLVVLHPASAAGLPLRVEHTDGRVSDTHFPDTISPSQPVFDIRTLRHAPAEGIEVACRLDAELPQDPHGRFEMEDQRNWSDASFKTYVGSLLDPWPYVLPTGHALRQSMTLEITERASRPASARTHAEPTLRFGPASGARLPPIGLAMPQLPAPPDTTERLAQLAPQWLVVFADPAQPELDRHLRAAATLAQRLDARVQLEAALPAERPPAEEIAALAARCAEAGLRPDAVLVCPRALMASHQPSGPWPDLPALEAFYAAARSAFPTARIGGGMLTYFTELNRKRPTGAGVDFISHTTAPIVHAADDASVMETLESLPHMARSVRAIWPSLGYRIGPSSIAMRSNPYGATTVANAALLRVPLADRDPRQAGLFGAAWTIGTAAALAAAGLEMLALHASHGPSALLPDAGAPVAWRDAVPDAVVLPAFHALRLLARLAGAEMLPSIDALPGLAVVAGRLDNVAHAVVANTGAVPMSVRLPEGWRARHLDTAEFAAASRDPLWMSGVATPLAALTLGPYAIARLEGPAP